ncbi:MAG: HAMP domain-containing sensor histidine kinase, partial [Rubrivivax sp.]
GTSMNEPRDLAQLLDASRDHLLQRWRHCARQLESARSLSTPALDDHVPMLLSCVVDVLRGDAPSASTPGAPVHGSTRLHEGYALDEVVAELSLLRACTIELPEQAGHVLRGAALRELNTAFDCIVGDAVAAYVAETHGAMRRQHAEHLAFIAHDLRSPLNAVALSIEVLKRSWPTAADSEADAPRMLRSLSRSVLHLTALVDTVFEDSIAADARRHASTPLMRVGVVDLQRLIGDLAQRFEADANAAGSHITVDVTDGLTVWGDAVLLERALQNLLVNAIEHASPGPVRIQVSREGAAVWCRVHDQGGGFAAVPAATPPPDRTGHGLGLAIARQFVQAHGGELRIASRSSGSTVTIELPDNRSDARPATGCKPSADDLVSTPPVDPRFEVPPLPSA